jgi:D-3-phosphoglycerate dehydrogenase
MPRAIITPEAVYQVTGPYVDILEDAGFEVRYPKDSTFSRGVGPDETVEELKDVDAIVAGGDYLTADVLSRLPKMRVIARAGVGTDRVDIAAATANNILLTIAPDSNHEAVAEQALALLFAVTRSVCALDRAIRAGEWPQGRQTPLRGQTFGLLGLGRIGKSTAKRAASLDMTLIASELAPDAEFAEQYGIELVDFDTLLARSDFLSVHCPLNDKTQGMFNRTLFEKMKRGSILINTARGGLVVEEDLVTALESGHLAGAGLDVFEPEPPRNDHPLLAMGNVVLSPHIASTDDISLVRMIYDAAECIVKLYRGEWPEGCVVNEELREKWTWER